MEKKKLSEVHIMCYDAVLPSGSDTWSNCAFWIYFNKIHKEFINMWGKNICIFKIHLYFFLGIYWLFTCPVKSTSSWLQEYSTGSLIILKQLLCIPSKGSVVATGREVQLPLQLVLPGAIHDMALRAWQLFATFLKEAHTVIFGWK